MEKLHDNPAAPVLRPATFDEWMAALDRYPKTKGRLHDSDGYCCLGVLADIEGAGWATDNPELTKMDETGDHKVRQSGVWLGAEGGELQGFLAAEIGTLEADTGKRRPVLYDLTHVNDESNTFAPVIAKARELYAEWKAAQR